MQILIQTIICYLFHLLICVTVMLSSVKIYAQKTDLFVTGNIRNYAEQYLYLYECYGDTLLFIDSVKTDNLGKFTVSFSNPKRVENTAEPSDLGLYRFNLPHNQWFYILNDGKPAQIKTVYQQDAFYNIVTDSLTIIKSEENKRFYKFQQLQQQLNIANYWLLQMIRLYPLEDPFHKQLENEYFARHQTMVKFISDLTGFGMAAKIAFAYYQPINPDWKQPDTYRDSIIAAHYFDYFNPADSFYLNTNILPEKMELYLKLKTNKVDNYGQPIHDEMLVAIAAEEFLNATKDSTGFENLLGLESNFNFCLKYFLKKFNKEHNETAFLHLCDQYLKPKQGDCEAEKNQFNWAREKASKLRNISIGSIAPDFKISDNLQLSGIESDYTLLLFWASWCTHCKKEVPEIKKAVDDFNSQFSSSNIQLITVAVSLDTDHAQWQKFVTENNLLSFLNFSELKGWKGEISKQYNVYATPTLFLLDKDKKIITKPITVEELKKDLKFKQIKTKSQ